MKTYCKNCDPVCHRCVLLGKLLHEEKQRPGMFSLKQFLKFIALLVGITAALNFIAYLIDQV